MKNDCSVEQENINSRIVMVAQFFLKILNIGIFRPFMLDPLVL